MRSGIISFILPEGSLPENESGFDDISGAIARTIERSKEEAAATRKGYDERLKIAIRDFAVKACSDPDSATQDELDALTPPSNENSVLEYPAGIGAYNSCARGLYTRLVLQLGEGQRLHIEAIRSALNPLPAAQSPRTPEIPAAAATPDPTEINRRLLIASLNDQVRTMQDIVNSVCEGGSGELTSNDWGRYATAYEILERNYHPYGDQPIATIPGYEPYTALDGLSGCAHDVLSAYLQSPSQDIQYLNHNARQAYQKYHPVPDAPVSCSVPPTRPQF